MRTAGLRTAREGPDKCLGRDLGPHINKRREPLSVSQHTHTFKFPAAMWTARRIAELGIERVEVLGSGETDGPLPMRIVA